MKIKTVSCTQFAGVRDRHVSFTDGINVVYGKNESGKSTLVNLISRTLFQRAKLDRRSDKDFFELYFPGAKKDSRLAGDFADGKITLETEHGTYTLSKEWGADARCSLSTPDGVLRDVSKIDEVLREVLLYGEGVYADMLFSSQRNTDMSLQTILDASKKTEAKQELADAVSQAFAESDGVSVDAIEQAITATIEEIAGKHWDFEREAPVRKNGRWSAGLGDILKAYYAWEDAKDTLAEISRLEQEADRASADYTDKDRMARAAEEAYNRFRTFASRLAVQSERKQKIDRIEADLLKITDVLSKWPQLSAALEKAAALQTEQANRRVLNAWNFVNDARAELSDEDRATAKLPCPESAEIAKAKAIQREITRLENTLCGMNLTAAIRLFGENTVEITSLRSGENVDISTGLASITEAVRMVIPGVMELQLSPADVNAAFVEEQLATQNATLAALLTKYQVDTADALELYAQNIARAKAKEDHVHTRIARALGDISPEQLEAMYRSVDPHTRSDEDIDRDISAVCGNADVATFLAKTETVIDGYVTEYGSINDLKANAFDLETELKKAKASVSDAEDIPSEYLHIADPESHLEALQNALKLQQHLRESALTEKTSAAGRLDAFRETHPEAGRDTVEAAQRHFEETKSLLNHWLRIADVFKAQKETIRDNPMQDIADRFAHYLGRISDGRISSEFPEADKLNMSIYSENTLLDYGKLSEGTKETVSLAFRLAVLDHLFPDGGVIVFDDPFTDMDAERTAQSCELIKDCATRHQVIFLTCKEEYLHALEGNCIRF